MFTYIPGRHQGFLFGGFASNGRVDDTWILDAEALTWSMAEDIFVPEESTDTSIPGFPAWMALASIGLLGVYWTQKH